MEKTIKVGELWEFRGHIFLVVSIIPRIKISWVWEHDYCGLCVQQNDKKLFIPGFFYHLNSKYGSRL